VGCGPRLQLDLPDSYADPDFQRTVPVPAPDDLARAVERRWCEWCEAVGYVDKIRVLADAEDTDGEALAYFTTDDSLPAVRLDLRVVECDRLTTPYAVAFEDFSGVDGIEVDAAGRPAWYYVLRRHPFDLYAFGFDARLVSEWERMPARRVVHLFERERPEQYRGVPLMTAALPLYAWLRRLSLAALGSAELAAMISGVIEDPNGVDGPEGEGAPLIEEMESVPFTRGALLTLTGGKKAHAFMPAQPAPSFSEFTTQILTEAGRSAGEMRNTSTGSSADYNYSSGRLDHLPRQRGIRIRRDRYDRELNDRVFREWLAEALLIDGYLPADLPPVSEWNWRWHWDGFESIDPVKDASAAEIRKRIGLTTDAEELAKEGKDWREVYRQLGRERQEREKLGIPHPLEGAGENHPAPTEQGAPNG
jgi:lambda family phage portal protein